MLPEGLLGVSVRPLVGYRGYNLILQLDNGRPRPSSCSDSDFLDAGKGYVPRVGSVFGAVQASRSDICRSYREARRRVHAQKFKSQQRPLKVPSPERGPLAQSWLAAVDPQEDRPQTATMRASRCANPGTPRCLGTYARFSSTLLVAV